MTHIRRLVSCIVIMIAGILFVSDATAQIRIQLFPQRRARPHFMVYPHHRSWADQRYYERRNNYQMERRRDFRMDRRRVEPRGEDRRDRGRR